MVQITLFPYFEAFNKDFIKNLTSYEEIIFHIDYEQLDNYGHLDIDKLNNELKNRFGLDLSKDFNAWEDLRENYYRRNVIVHNKFQVSKIYNDKMSKNEGIGSKLKNNPNY